MAHICELFRILSTVFSETSYFIRGSHTSQRRDMMLEEMKELRDKTMVKWERALNQTRDIKAVFLDNINSTDKELVTRAKQLHEQVDIILSQNRRTLEQIKSSGLTELQKQEKYLADRLQQLTEEVQTYEDQLNYGDTKALFQFKKGRTVRDDDKSLPNTIKTMIVDFIQGQNDDKVLNESFGNLSTQDIVYTTGTDPQYKEQIKPSAETKKGLPSNLSSTSDGRPRALIAKPKIQSRFKVETSNHPHIACVGQGFVIMVVWTIYAQEYWKL